MVNIVYAMCALTSLLCAVLLFRAYLGNGYRLLWWSGLCFSGLALNNAVLILDKLLLPDTDLTTLRLSIALVALLPLLYGLIFDE
ncbi:MAG: DUF5985 family protein [Pseudomonadota bacterium]